MAQGLAEYILPSLMARRDASTLEPSALQIQTILACSAVLALVVAGCSFLPDSSGQEEALAAAARTASALQSDCADEGQGQFASRSLCVRNGGGFDLFNPESGEFIGSSHGPDSIPEPPTERPSAVALAAPRDAQDFQIDASRISEPFCVRDPAAPALRFVMAAASDDPASRDLDASSAVWYVKRSEIATLVTYLVGAFREATNDASTLRVHCPQPGNWGPQQVQVAILPREKAHYDSFANAGRLVWDLSALDPNLGRPNAKPVVLYNDPSACWTSNGASSRAYCGGIGFSNLDDRPDSRNANNGFDAQFAIIYGYNDLHFFMHEVGHILGAVQDRAPFSTAAGHCFKVKDVMCYDDGGNGIPRPPENCPTGSVRYSGNLSYWAGLCDKQLCSKMMFDCGNDAYCNSKPGAATYLATHWNLCSANNAYIQRYLAPPASSTTSAAAQNFSGSTTSSLSGSATPTASANPPATSSPSTTSSAEAGTSSPSSSTSSTGTSASGSHSSSSSSAPSSVPPTSSTSSSSQPPSQNPSRIISEVSSGYIGPHLDLVIGSDGRGIISYSILTTGYPELWVAHCNNEPCTSSAATLLDPLGGVYSAIAIQPNGLPMILSQGDSGGKQVAKLHRCGNMECTSITTTILESVDQTGVNPNIAFGPDNLPFLTYENDAWGLTLVHCKAIDCSAFNRVHPVPGGAASLVFGTDGLPLVSFTAPYGYGEIETIHCKDLDCTTWDNHPIQPGTSSKVVLASDGHPMILYRDHYGFLVVAACQQASCSTFETKETGVEGSNSRLLIGPGELPQIAYDDMGLHLLSCLTPLCEWGGQQTVVDSTGWPSSIGFVLVHDRPLLAYPQKGTGKLLAAYCPTIGCM